VDHSVWDCRNHSTAAGPCLLDECREVWSSGPSAATLAARNSWKQLSLSEALSWTQSSSDIEMRLLLPAGVCAGGEGGVGFLAGLGLGGEWGGGR
jgi:hypothetical protein